MFDKLTARERNLAIGISFLLPATLLFMGVFWVIDKYNTNKTEIEGQVRKLEDEEIRELVGKKAERRRQYYNAVSLSPRVADASNEYVTWLRTLLNESNLRYSSFQPKNGGEFKVKGKLVGRIRSISIPTTGKLNDLTDFLTRFYEVDTLHRIRSLKLIPKNEPGSRDKKIRTGDISIAIDIEFCSLKTAEENPDFYENKRELARSADVYKDAILRRNLFGPPNNTPTISARPSSSYYSDVAKVTVPVTAKDADENDILDLELVESSVEGAELVYKEGSRTAKLVLPGQEAGKKEFKIRVVDNGFPAKESIITTSLTFKDRPKPKPKEEVVIKKPKPFMHAKETKITGITRLKNGDWQVWIKVRTTGDKYKLLVGESFKLDKRDWVVKSIEPHSAVFEVESKLLTFNETVTFDKPISEVLKEGAKPESDPVKPTDTSAVIKSGDDEAILPLVATR